MSNAFNPAGFDDPNIQSEINKVQNKVKLIETALMGFNEKGFFEPNGELKKEVEYFKAYLYFGLKNVQADIQCISSSEIQALLLLIEFIISKLPKNCLEVLLVLDDVATDLVNLKESIEFGNTKYLFSGYIAEESNRMSSFETIMLKKIPYFYSTVHPTIIYHLRSNLIDLFSSFADRLSAKYPDAFREELKINESGMQDLILLITQCIDSQGNINIDDAYSRFEIWCNSNITLRTDEQFVTTDEHFLTESSEYGRFERKKTFLGTLVQTMLDNSNDQILISDYCRMIYLGLTIIDGGKLINMQEPATERKFLVDLLKEIQHLDDSTEIYRCLNSVLEDLINDCEIKEEKSMDPEGESIIVVVNGEDFKNLLHRILPSIYAHLNISVNYIEVRNLLLQLFEVLKGDFESIFMDKGEPTEFQLHQIRKLAEILGYWINKTLSSKSPEEYSYALQEIYITILPRILIWSGKD